MLPHDDANFVRRLKRAADPSYQDLEMQINMDFGSVYDNSGQAAAAALLVPGDVHDGLALVLFDLDFSTGELSLSFSEPVLTTVDGGVALDGCLLCPVVAEL